MATRRYMGNAGDSLETITEAVGAATASKTVELTIDFATSAVTEGASTRAIKKLEVLVILNLFEQYILRDTSNNWVSD